MPTAPPSAAPADEPGTAAADRAATGPRVSLARIVIVMYIAGLLAALIAGGAAEHSPRSQSGAPASAIDGR